MIINQIRAEKERRGLTNQQLADRSGVPVGSVNRILSGQTESPNYDTIVSLCRTLDLSVDKAEGIYVGEEQEKSMSDKLIKSYTDDIAYKKKWIHVLFGACAALVFVVVFLLVFDIVNPTIGYVRY